MEREDREGTFFYRLVPSLPGDLESLAERFALRVAEHAKKHDFAQLIRADRIAVLPGRGGAGVLVPFRRNHHREIPAIGWYLRTLGRTIGLRLEELILPGGDTVTIEADPSIRWNRSGQSAPELRPEGD